MSNNIKNKALKRRILDISYAKKLSHIGSCLTAVDIIDDIYKAKGEQDVFILSAGHAGLALYCVLEKYEHKDAEKIFDEHGVHPDRCTDCGITYSAGSLGHGIGAAVGMALADRKRTVYCLITDGECAEGSVWEAFNIANKLHLENLHIHVNMNGWGAYDVIARSPLADKIREHTQNLMPPVQFHLNGEKWFDYLSMQQAHYTVLNKQQYEQCCRLF